MSESMKNPGCAEWQQWSRRKFLQRSFQATAAAGLLPKVAMGGGGGGEDRDVFVHIFLRGAMDGLTTVVPYGDPELYLARPTVAVPEPGQTNGAIDLDGFFGLSPAASPLMTPYNNGHLAFVHASGSPDPSRSHFDAMTIMEFGVPNQSLANADGGWLARHINSVAPLGPGAFRGCAVMDLLPETFAGAQGVVPVPDMANFNFPGYSGTAELRKALTAQMYEEAIEPVRSAALGSLATIEILKTIDFDGYAPTGGAAYPDSELGHGLRQTAALIKADVGVEAVMLEKGGWDLHNELGIVDGDMAALLDDFSKSLEAFYLDMLGDIGKITVVVVSEFGRRVAENGSLGADHGHGNAMMVLGGSVAGGQVIADWPGLAPANLFNGDDLEVTIDYRSVLAEILEKRMGNTDLANVFPNFTPVFPGVIV